MTTTKDLIEQIKEDFLVDHDKDNPLWTSGNIARALTQSQREIARRCMLIQDSTSTICFLTLAADSVTGLFPQTIPLSSKVLRVRFVFFPGNNPSTVPGCPSYRNLQRTTTEFLNAHSREHWGHDWGWIGRNGHIELFLTDFQYQSLTFNYVPKHGGIVQIGVIRLPLNDLSHDRPNSEPEIKEYDLELIHGALKYLYGKGFLSEDTETYDPIKESRWRKEFEEDIRRIIRDKAALQPKQTICQPEHF